VAGKMKLQQELALISNLDVMVSMDSGNAHIAAMLGVKLSHFGVLRILMPVFTVPSAFRKYFGFRQGTISHATSVYGNKIVCYEDAMRTITQEMVVMSVQTVRRLNLKKFQIPILKLEFGILNNRIFIF
jgi:hypothetical protein